MLLKCNMLNFHICSNKYFIHQRIYNLLDIILCIIRSINILLIKIQYNYLHNDVIIHQMNLYHDICQMDIFLLSININLLKLSDNINLYMNLYMIHYQLKQNDLLYLHMNLHIIYYYYFHN